MSVEPQPTAEKKLVVDYNELSKLHDDLTATISTLKTEIVEVSSLLSEKRTQLGKYRELLSK